MPCLRRDTNKLFKIIGAEVARSDEDDFRIRLERRTPNASDIVVPLPVLILDGWPMQLNRVARPSFAWAGVLSPGVLLKSWCPG